MITRHALLLLSLCLSATGCRNDRRDNPDYQPLQPVNVIVYVRAGGIAGADDRIIISRDGEVRISGRFFGNTTSTLTEFQLLQLARLFEGWDKLQPSYPAPPGMTDAMSYSITYGDKTVSAADGNADLPEQFQLIRRRLEQLARTLPASQPAR